MALWNIWMALVNQLRTACSRNRSFFWLVIVLIGFSVKSDFLGVTSLARGAGLMSCYYTSLLNFFNSTAINLGRLQGLWIKLIFSGFSGIVILNGRCLVVGDGIKVAKEGRKMPGVKWLHQESESNSKAEYIMGHSIQAVSVLVKGLRTFFAVPLIAQIHEGICFHYQDSRTLLDKMFAILMKLSLPKSFYFIADKYYCSGQLMKQLIASGVHMITMMKKNAVAYYPATSKSQGRGRPKKYGKRVKLFDLFKTNLDFVCAPMPNHPSLMIEYCVFILYWRPLGDFAQFIYTRHPTRGEAIVMSTDLSLIPLDIIFGYSLRFKIEVSFKQAVHQIGTFMYRFWLKAMGRRKRKSGDQQLQFAPESFKGKVIRKLNAYHLFIQLGFIAHGLMQYLSIHQHQSVWNNFGSWLRTIRPHTLPSEKVVSLSLSNTFEEFLADEEYEPIFKKFLKQKRSKQQNRHPLIDERMAA